jgi:flagellar M-ring protein FliF
MENQKLGSSQFIEQVNFQRAMEGELARSIESIGAVKAARVHLAMPKDSIFVSEQKAATASVLLNLHPGRALDPQQVSAIVHLVASSVPELPTKNVTVVDQNGNLLSDTSKAASTNGMDPSQIKYVQELQQSVVKRIESIITPIVGSGNVRAEATADVDFSRSEQAVETYKPNQTPDSMAIRSQQTSESLNSGANPGGVPGALSNQPPAPATAPINAPAGQSAAKAPATAATPPATSTQKDATTNFEVDKTIQYVQQGVGGLKRLSVAVVVNHRKSVDAKGKVSMKPLSPAETAQITNLVKEAMGYNQARGDTLNVVNSAFATTEQEAIPETPIWKQPGNIQVAKDMGKYLLMGVALFLLYTRMLKPMLKKIGEAPAAAPVPAQSGQMLPGGEHPALPLTPQAQHSYQDNLTRAQKLASEDPRVVANIVKTWVGNNE